MSNVVKKRLKRIDNEVNMFNTLISFRAKAGAPKQTIDVYSNEIKELEEEKRMLKNKTGGKITCLIN